MTENNVQSKNALTDEQLDSIVKVAEESRNKENDMLDLKDSVKVDESADLESNIESIAEKVDPSKPVDLSSTEEKALYDDGVITGDLETALMDTDTDIPSNDAIKQAFEVSDDDAFKIIDIVNNIRKTPNYPVYKNLPLPVKEMVHDIAESNGLPISKYEEIARLVMSEFMNTAEVEEALIDFDKAMSEALKIPHVIDIYTDHYKNIMEKNIPEMIENIKDTEPEKAEMLRKVQEIFKWSYTFSFAKKAYEENGRVRKAVRRYDLEFKRCLENFNFRNTPTQFKMNDAMELPIVLNQILCEDPANIIYMHTKDGMEPPEFYNNINKLGVSDIDIQKFCILICKSCDTLNPHDTIDAAYMYYLIKNIVVLKHTQEAKTDFAAELINNICDTIAFIRNKEAEFYAANLDKPKQKQKRNMHNSVKK